MENSRSGTGGRREGGNAFRSLPDASTRLVGLLGYPVAHSLSPLIHNTAFRAQGLNNRYIALPVAPADVAEAVAGLKALGFLGSNVTIPHKQAVLSLMDALSAEARAVGAVNTIVCRRDGEAVTLYGDNTDVAGFLEPLNPFADVLHGAPMLIFGAGGAARAVAYALLSTFAPDRLTLAARTPARAERLAADLAAYDPGGALRVVAPSEAAPSVRAARLLVNATPVGMHPHTDATPWPDTDDFSDGQIVYDLLYKPEQTRLLREAALRGAHPLGGLAMLILQAAASYIQWTGQAMPVDLVRAVLREVGF